MPGLRVKNGKCWQEFPITEKSFIIGRAADCDHVIDSGFISRHHCKITLESEGHFLVDLGSSLGTCVNGREVKRVSLQFGDRIRLADRWDAIFVGEAELAFTETLASVAADGLVHYRRLVALDGDWADKVFDVAGSLLRIGRHDENDICLPVETVSSFHAQLVCEGTDWVISDLGSSNGTFVNQARVQRKLLKNGDQVRIDRFSFRFDDLPVAQGRTGTRIRHGSGQVPARPGPELPLAHLPQREAPTFNEGQSARGTTRIWWLVVLLLLIALGLGLICYLLWAEGFLSLAALPENTELILEETSGRLPPL